MESGGFVVYAKKMHTYIPIYIYIMYITTDVCILLFNNKLLLLFELFLYITNKKYSIFHFISTHLTLLRLRFFVRYTHDQAELQTITK